MNETTDQGNGVRWAIGLGGVALVAGIVALVLAISNGNDSATETQVNDSVASLDKRLDTIEGEATAAGETGKKAEQNLNKAEKQAKKAQGENTAQLSNISDQLDSLTKKVDDLSSQQATQQQEIKQLQKDVKKLK